MADAIAAGIYAYSNIVSWGHAKEMPRRQADANKEVLERQRKDYEAITVETRGILKDAIRKYIDNVNGILNADSFEEAFNEIPEAAEYVPVDACCIQESTIECNIEHTNRARDYVNYVNRLHEQNDLIHALSMDPRFLVTLDIQSQSIQDLTRGVLPVGDVIEIIGDGAELAAMTGRIGNTRKTTARDLGISKLRAQAAGRKEFREATAWANSAVSPQARQGDIRDSMQTPAQRIALALHQAQLIQQSLQNKNNQLSQSEPWRMARLQTKLQNQIALLQTKSSEALLVNTHVPNYAATIVPNTSNVSGLVGAIGQGISNANLSHFFGGPPADNQTGYRGGFTGNDTSGYSNR
jgi:hypothetical protein